LGSPTMEARPAMSRSASRPPPASRPPSVSPRVSGASTPVRYYPASYPVSGACTPRVPDLLKIPAVVTVQRPAPQPQQRQQRQQRQHHRQQQPQQQHTQQQQQQNKQKQEQQHQQQNGGVGTFSRASWPTFYFVHPTAGSYVAHGRLGGQQRGRQPPITGSPSHSSTPNLSASMAPSASRTGVLHLKSLSGSTRSTTAGSTADEEDEQPGIVMRSSFHAWDAMKVGEEVPLSPTSPFSATASTASTEACTHSSLLLERQRLRSLIATLKADVDRADQILQDMDPFIQSTPTPAVSSASCIRSPCSDLPTASSCTEQVSPISGTRSLETSPERTHSDRMQISMGWLAPC